MHGDATMLRGLMSCVDCSPNRFLAKAAKSAKVQGKEATAHERGSTPRQTLEIGFGLIRVHPPSSAVTFFLLGALGDLGEKLPIALPRRSPASPARNTASYNVQHARRT
jgi:hypothetical protein